MIENVEVIKVFLSKGQYKAAFANLSKLAKHLKKTDRNVIVHLLARYNQNERDKISGRNPPLEYRQYLELLRGDLLDFLERLESDQQEEGSKREGDGKLGRLAQFKQAYWPLVVAFLLGGLVFGGLSEVRHWQPLDEGITETEPDDGSEKVANYAGEIEADSINNIGSSNTKEVKISAKKRGDESPLGDELKKEEDLKATPQKIEDQE